MESKLYGFCQYRISCPSLRLTKNLNCCVIKRPHLPTSVQWSSPAPSFLQRVSKTIHLTFNQTFSKCRPIFKILLLPDFQGNSLFETHCMRVCLLFSMTSQKAMQLGSPNLTKKRFKMSPGYPFTLESNDQYQVRHYRSWVTKEHCRCGPLHSCECWLLALQYFHAHLPLSHLTALWNTNKLEMRGTA